MNSLKLEETITKLNCLTNNRYQLSADQKQLCIDGSYYFCIHWIDGAKFSSSVQNLESNAKSVSIFNRITPSQSKQHSGCRFGR